MDTKNCFSCSLLKEAKPINMEDPDSSTEQLKPPLSVNLPDPISVEDRQLLGRLVALGKSLNLLDVQLLLLNFEPVSEK